MLYDRLMIIFSLFIALYGSLVRPELPPFVKVLFNHYLFRLVILSFIAYRANHDPTLSIVIAIAFMSTLNMLVQGEMKESFLQLEHFREIEHFYNDEINANEQNNLLNDNIESDQ